MSALAALIDKKTFMEGVLGNTDASEDNSQVLDELMVVWNNNEMALANKIDRYGFVLEEFEHFIEDVELDDSRNADLIDRTKNEIKKIKQRLNYLSQGEKLKGNKFTFSPYVATPKKVDIAKVEDEYKNFSLPKLTYKEWVHLRQALSNYYFLVNGTDGTDETISLIAKVKEAKESVLVTDLPDGHAAVTVGAEPTVRITRKKVSRKQVSTESEAGTE